MKGTNKLIINPFEMKEAMDCYLNDIFYGGNRPKTQSVTMEKFEGKPTGNFEITLVEKKIKAEAAKKA